MRAPRHETDEQLLAATGHDPAAFGHFYRRHEAALLGFFGRLTRSAELAADLTAETFAAALAGRAGFDPARGSARMWLFGIARNVLGNSLRRGRVDSEARRRLGFDLLVIEPAQLRAIDALIVEEGDQRVRGWLAELPPEQAEAIRARVLDERSYAEIASELRCSEAVVRKRVSRGLGRLRQRLQEDAA